MRPSMGGKRALQTLTYLVRDVESVGYKALN